MCLGEPMRVIECSDFTARCRGRDGNEVDIDLSLVGPQAPDTWLLCFLGAAREVISPERAEAVNGALAALAAVQAGERDFSAYFADLEREPELPEFLRAAYRQ